MKANYNQTIGGYDAAVLYEKQVRAYNSKIIRKLAKEFNNNGIIIDFKECAQDCLVTGKVEVVKSPEGEDQDDSRYKCFKAIWVDQYPVGIEGDNFEGFIYGQLDKKRWLKIPYSI